ncbi:MAG: SAM-dependent methyltransferase [Bacteroidales bacterium]|jgi:16S rRNA (cytidine1402-2'-O)-methyltransferase|nr:SAM-dependent methyltransferase [Bacteroidales bacterium]
MSAPLFLLPSPLGEGTLTAMFPLFNFQIINSIDYYIVEELRTARRFLRKMNIDKAIDDLTFLVLNEHSKQVNGKEYLQPCLEGHNMGLLSEAGTPCIADPGHVIVAAAHQLGIEVIPLVGPNSIILSLMASGFNGQNFSFHGYLPTDSVMREKEILFYETLTKKTGQTQIFIETPYRNEHLFHSFLKVCDPVTRLCIACNLTTPEQSIVSQSIAKWKKENPDIHKRPVVFLIN